MSFAAELDELMGINRNADKNEVIRQEHFSDPDVCKYNLVSICPYELFPNTKYDLGKCPRRKDEFFKKQFQNTDEKERVHYEIRFIDETIQLTISLGLFSKQIAIVDNKIKASQVRLDDSGRLIENIPLEYREKIENVDAEIKKLLRYVEQLGELGKIEESEKLTEEIERLKKNKQDLWLLAENPTLAKKQMKVCEICGAMQAINDTEVRNQNHLEGKVHTGFALLRSELEELKKRKEMLKLLVTAERREREKKKSKKKKKRRRDRSDSREERRKRKKRRKRDRSRSRSWDERRRRKEHRKKHKKRKRRHRGTSEDGSDEGEVKGVAGLNGVNGERKKGSRSGSGARNGARKAGSRSSVDSGELR